MKTEYRKSYISWDECFMRMAHVIAERSKDPSSQVGAVLADQNHVVVGLGYNGFPRGIDAEEFPWEREGPMPETKYAYICHAEENAVYNSNGSTKGCRIYCTMFPCNECTKTLIQNGITEIIYEWDKYPNHPEYIAAKRMLHATGIAYRQYSSTFDPNRNEEEFGI